MMESIIQIQDDVVKKTKAVIDEYVTSQIIYVTNDDKYDFYIVKGKPVAICNHAFDLNDSYDVFCLLSLSDSLFDKDKFLPAIYGSDTMAVVMPLENGEYTVSMVCISDLPDDVEQSVRSVMNDYKRDS